jgi:hypothetical protein
MEWHRPEVSDGRPMSLLLLTLLLTGSSCLPFAGYSPNALRMSGTEGLEPRELQVGARRPAPSLLSRLSRPGNNDPRDDDGEPEADAPHWDPEGRRWTR